MNNLNNIKERIGNLSDEELNSLFEFLREQYPEKFPERGSFDGSDCWCEEDEIYEEKV